MSQLMTTREVAEYLRIKERKVYDLVHSKRIPCTRVTGKWLFPKNLIDIWVAEGTEFPELARARAVPVPPVCAGSHDPLLDWSLRESGCGLAMMASGSLDGLTRIAHGEAMLAGMHVFEPDTGGYNEATCRRSLNGLGVVLIEWAWRQQGLVLAPGNPLGIETVADLRDKKARVVVRQEGAGSRVLFEHLTAEAGLETAALDTLDAPARNETDLGLAVLEGKADAGLAVAAVARDYRLDFIALHRERYDLLIRHRDYFEPPVQALIRFTTTDAFRAKATDMDGYDVSGTGRVGYSGG